MLQYTQLPSYGDASPGTFMYLSIGVWVWYFNGRNISLPPTLEMAPNRHLRAFPRSYPAMK